MLLWTLGFLGRGYDGVVLCVNELRYPLKFIDDPCALLPQDDLIVLRFEGASIDSNRALMGYMDTMTKDHSNALEGSVWFNKFKLKKVLERWGRQDDQGTSSASGAAVLYFLC